MCRCSGVCLCVCLSHFQVVVSNGFKSHLDVNYRVVAGASIQAIHGC